MEHTASVVEPSRGICYAWERTGMCRLGSSCRNHHDQDLAYQPPDYAHRVWSNKLASTSTTDAFGSGGEWNFSVMSYNVLADSLAIEHAKELYRAVPESCLPWQKRSIKLLNELLHWRPDIVCLQEIDHPDDFTNILSGAGYAWEYAARTGGRKDGCLTLWQKCKFKTIARDVVHMSEHNLKDNVGLIVVLKLLEGPGVAQHHRSPVLAVANTHLLFNPRRGDIKLGQAGLMLRRIAAVCNELQVTPLSIFAGDFNSTPHSGIYSFLKNGELDLFLEDRRVLSGQLEAKEQTKWLPNKCARKGGLQRSDSDRPRGRSLDDPLRGAGRVEARANDSPREGVVGITPDQRPLLGSLTRFTGSFDRGATTTWRVTATEASTLSGHFGRRTKFCTPLQPALLLGAHHSGPPGVFGRAPLYPYVDEFGQRVYSHIPPSDDIRRQPFYHQPMVVEEAKPQLPMPTSGPIRRTVSFAARQANAGTWTNEQLLTATGATDTTGTNARWAQSVPNANDLWVAEHPLPMHSAYEAVLGTEPAYTSCHGKFIGTVDYLWFTRKAHHLRMTPTNVLLPPPIESLHCGLPSPEWPSDHISLLTRFSLAQTDWVPPLPHEERTHPVPPRVTADQAAGTERRGEEPESPPPLPVEPGLLIEGLLSVSAPADPPLPPPHVTAAARKNFQRAVQEGIVPKIIATELRQHFTV